MNDLHFLLPAFVSQDQLAPEFDASFYRLVQIDLKRMTPAQLADHYEEYGRGEGRLATPAAHRSGFLAQIPPQGVGLEIGPGVEPTLTGDGVRYFDVQDKAGLVARAASDGYPTERCPDIDYVSPLGDLSVVTDQFDYVFSSHCIEHQPDLARHLQGVARLLHPNGRYYIIIPDKRYCFDALLPESTLDEVLVAHAEGRTVHTIANIYNHYALTTHNDILRHWYGDSQDPRLDVRHAREMEAAQAIANANGGYIDVHAWQFTPSSFRTIINGLAERNLCPFLIERIYDSTFGSNEFCVVLTRRD